LVSAVKKHKRIVQVGSQQRTMEMNLFACKFIREGGLGKMSQICLPNYPGPLRYEDHKDTLPEQEKPAGCQWDLFCGPTPLRAYHQKLWAKEELGSEHFTWRGWDMWRDYSGHLMANHGAHTVDMVQLALGTDDTGPIEARPEIEGYTGEMHLCPVTMRYANGVELKFAAPGELYVGEKGTLSMRRNAFSVDPPELVKDSPDPEVRKKWLQPPRKPTNAAVRGTWDNENIAGPHIKNWLDCIRTRATPNAPIEAGHRSATICHLANLARELRRTLRWDPQREAVLGDDEANRLLDRPRRTGFEFPV
jgi:predicted dehydrogenase